MGFIRRELCHEKRPPEGRRNSNQKFIGSEYSLPYGFVFAKRLQFQLMLPTAVSSRIRCTASFATWRKLRDMKGRLERLRISASTLNSSALSLA